MADDEIKAVLFDLGDTILNFGRVRTIRAFLEGAKASYAFLKEHSQPVGGFPWFFLSNLLRLRTEYLVSNVLQRDFNSMELLQSVGARQGVNLSLAQWEEFAWLWYEPLSRRAKIEADLPQTLSQLRSMGLKLGIVSNTFVNRTSLERHLQVLGILEFFSLQVYSYEFHFRKPNVEIFRIAATRIGEEPRHILFVGDRIDNDIRPALQSGMKAVLKEAYTNRRRKIPPGTLKIRRLAELPALLERVSRAPAPDAARGG